MALTQGARNKIKSFVQKAKRLLMEEFDAQLQQHYGIRPDGSSLMVEELTTKDGSIIQTARLLRERLDYLEDTIAGNNQRAEAVEQLVREQAFTILNRFAALRMAEERNIVREAVRQGYNSEGFQVFDQLTGGAQSAEQFVRYTWYIKAVFDEMAIDLPAVFDRFSPYALLFPSEKVLLELLDIINDEDLHIFREEGQQPLNLWQADETIGWVYQYYNSREEISAMRDASGAPRNSRELAVRNQFFTPRYVVQFLVDNSLGRQWYEMNQGDTALVDDCQYLVKRELEIFLTKGEDLPDAKIEGAHYLEHRDLKDPREILMLDPACGSMHFGLYCFDLFEKIYLEAWDKHPELMPDLRDKLLREEFVKQIPGMIIRHNIHGVDIDPRAIQIAGLSLWLRAQKSYDELGLSPQERPAISKSNLVVAEPMPGDADLLSEFTEKLPGPIGKLVRVIWDKMKLAGETGLLLKIEEELKKEIGIAKEEYKEYKDSSAQSTLFSDPAESKAAEMAAIYGKGQKISKDFFDTAEEEVLKALKSFSENAEGEHAFQKLLFAEDTARGFAFIELCRKRYDVIVMNPPFGATAERSKNYIDETYNLSKHDLACVFIDRSNLLLSHSGCIGAITTRTIYFLQTFQKWRTKDVLPGLNLFLDLGAGVLDAMVETSAIIINNQKNRDNSTFFRLTKVKNKNEKLIQQLINSDNDVFYKNVRDFKFIVNEPLSYWVNDETLELLKSSGSFKSDSRGAFAGLATTDNDRYTRNIWEVPTSSVSSESKLNNWDLFIISGQTNRYLADFTQVVKWGDFGKEIKATIVGKGLSITKRVVGESIYRKSGLSWAYRTARFAPHIVPRNYVLSSSRYLAIDLQTNVLPICALWNSTYFDYIIKLSLAMESGNPKFINGAVNRLPYTELSERFKGILEDISYNQINRVRECFAVDSTSVLFNASLVSSSSTLLDSSRSVSKKLISHKLNYLKEQDLLNQTVYSEYEINRKEIELIKESVKKVSEPDEGEIFNINENEIFLSLFNSVLGSIFGRWDLRILKHWKQEWRDDDIFKARKHSPFFYGPRESTLDLVLPEYHDKIKEIWKMPYPIETLDEVSTVSDTASMVDKLEEVIKYFWPETSDTIIYELQEHFRVNSLEEIFDKHSKFFDAHLKDYSRNKRISPIYWHMGVPSGKFNVWVYYPKLNENSLYKIVNELVEPKLEEVQKDIASLEMGGSAKELNDQQSLRDELLDFKDELLRVAQLPYKPNQDDGVLITAAPLHNLFRHTKWRKSTEDCWKKLEKGEYDWAHLAYRIWPDRVATKCKKDLSMAIAHGLESICEIKPKEKKTRTKKGVEMKTQTDLL